MSRNIFKSIFSFFLNFIIFFGTISFVVTCSFLVFFSSVNLSEADMRTFAPAVLFNVFILTLLFVISDTVRRKITVDRPAKQIQEGLRKLMNGEFDTKISVSYRHNKENRFKEIAESINLLAEELKSVETLRTDFIANVSHELKTPLSVMQNYGTLLQSPELTDEKRIEYSKSITESSRRLAGLITNILKLNRLENQQIFPKVYEYDLGEQLCECLIRFETVWEEAEIDIDTDIAEGIRIKADSELLSVVWNNLFSNAFKFTDTGGQVRVCLSADDDYAVVKVSDTGCGMTSEVGAHIFEKFYQGDTSHSSEGNGLGLSLVKRIIDITGGEISVISTLGEGSTFTVRLRRYIDGEN